jgi:Flp pilus assembly protein TadG
MKRPKPRPGPRTARLPSRARGGMVVVVVALVLGVLLGISALVVDLGYLGASQAQLQAATDASSHAGAMQLDGTDDGLANASQAALDLASFNEVAGEPVQLDDTTDIELGIWDIPTSTFTAGGDTIEINAVRVTARRDDLPAWFANAAFGEEVLAASAVSIAHRQFTGAGEVECFIPLAVPGCWIEDTGPDQVNFYDLVLNPVGANNVAWARPEANPNGSWLRNQIWNCEYDGNIDVGTSMELNNGVINSALAALAGEVEASSTVWDESKWGPLPPQETRSGISPLQYGHTLEGPIAVFENDSYCSSPSAMNGTEAVSGFVWGAIYEVVTSGKVADRTIKLRLETTEAYDMGVAAGGPDYGVEYRHLALVY